MKKQILCLAAIGLTGVNLNAQEKDTRPNFIFIMLDDFGVGQFAPSSVSIAESSFDPAFQKFVDARGLYTSGQALEASRTAMPTMMKLARQGINFSNAYASAALCAPSRCGVATGIHQNRFGIYENSDLTSGEGAPVERILIPFFQKSGYATGQIGKWHLGPLDNQQYEHVLLKHGLSLNMGVGALRQNHPAVYKELDENGYLGSVVSSRHPLRNGFDYYYGYNYHQSKFYDDTNVWENYNSVGRQEGYNTEVFTDKALAFIEQSIGDGKPFFVNISYHAVHGPLNPRAPDIYYDRFEGYPAVLRNFYAHVYAVDQAVNRIIGVLEQHGALNNTCIVFTSDNGAAVSAANTMPGNAPHRGQKGQYVQGGFKVPFLVYWPDKITSGRQSKALVSLLDMVPTAMDAAGLELPDNLDGKSLLPLIDGKTNNHHQNLVWFGLESCSWGFQSERSPLSQQVRGKEPGSWTVINGEWLLRFTGRVIPGIYSDAPNGIEPQLELYKIDIDPGETRNLVNQHQDVVKGLKAIAAEQAKTLPPPVVWHRDKWVELMHSLDVRVRN